MDIPGTPDHRAESSREQNNKRAKKAQNSIPKWLDPALENQRTETTTESTNAFHAQSSDTSMPEQHKPSLEQTTTNLKSFHLKDHVYLRIKPCPTPEPDTDPYAPQYCDHPELKYLSELHRASQESQHLLKPIADKHAATAHYLKNLNKRMGLLQQFIIATANWGNLQPNYHVMLSEEGLLIGTDTSTLDTGTLQGINAHNPNTHPDEAVHLQLVLFPQLAHLCVFGRASRSEMIDNQPHIAISFVNLHGAEQQILAKHILQKQIDQRRKHNSAQERS